MNYENQSATPSEKRFVPLWIKSILLWKFLSNVKLAFIRMAGTTLYWDRSHFLQTFRYFMAVENVEVQLKNFLHPFRFKDIEFDLRPMEWHLMDAILLENEYELVSRLFGNQLPSVIIDAGANVGMFSVYAFSVWPLAKIYAVEPGLETFKILEQNQKKNPSLNWLPLQYAFWESDGTVFFESDGLSMAAYVSEVSKGMQVPSIRFDHFMDQYLPDGERVSLLKMDIEGAEEVVLVASQSALSRVDAIVIEIHSEVCNESVIRDILNKEFPFIYDLSTPSTQYPVLLASRESLRQG